MARRVLIADDTADIVKLLSLLLTAADFEVVATAASGTAALDAWRCHRDDPLYAVVLDQRMPDLPGLDVARQIRRERPGQRVVLLTAQVDHDIRVDAEAVGATVLDKSQLTALASVLGEDVQ